MEVISMCVTSVADKGIPIPQSAKYYLPSGKECTREEWIKCAYPYKGGIHMRDNVKTYNGERYAHIVNPADGVEVCVIDMESSACSEYPPCGVCALCLVLTHQDDGMAIIHEVRHHE